MDKKKITVFWHRRDLRFHDNTALYHALQSEYPVLPVFIFDRNILDKLEDEDDLRVNFIHQEIQKIQREYEQHGGSLKVYYGMPEDFFKEMLDEFDVRSVYFNHDYEPYARERDKVVYHLLKDNSVAIKHFKDHVLVEKGEVLKADGNPYTVYTPYSRKWKELVTDNTFRHYPSEEHLDSLLTMDHMKIPSLEEMGFKHKPFNYPDRAVDLEIIKKYHNRRNFPAKRGTTRMSVHLRFGTVSIRELARTGKANNKFLNELIWRDFYAMILWNFPRVVEKAFKPAYDHIKWRNNEEEFKRWCMGKTGYPIVDAGMRELNETGYMHNRVRMIVASFLTKHLLIDWRWGEAYFARKLLDFEQASNNGGWQWAAGSGCDAAPYFRVFNPELQTQKFDKNLEYIKKWIPELDTPDYSEPIVDHKEARQRALTTYKEGLNS
jgi:deoxyribodipyrimidine photo-lyase